MFHDCEMRMVPSYRKQFARGASVGFCERIKFLGRFRSRIAVHFQGNVNTLALGFALKGEGPGEGPSCRCEIVAELNVDIFRAGFTLRTDKLREFPRTTRGKEAGVTQCFFSKQRGEFRCGCGCYSIESFIGND